MTCYFGRHFTCDDTCDVTCDPCKYRGDCDIYRNIYKSGEKEKEAAHEGEEKEVAD